MSCSKTFIQCVNNEGATWAFWFKRSANTVNYTLFKYQSNPSGQQIRITWQTDSKMNLVTGLNTDTGGVMSGVTPTIYNLVAITWSKSDNLTRVYVNDVVRVQSTVAVDFSTGQTAGVITWNGADPDQFYWDQVTMWAKVLSTDQLTALYGSGAGMVFPYVYPVPAPIVCWTFDNTLTDSVAGITMVNFPANNDFQPGKFAQAFHSNAGPAAFNISSTALAALIIP